MSAQVQTFSRWLFVAIAIIVCMVEAASDRFPDRSKVLIISPTCNQLADSLIVAPAIRFLHAGFQQVFCSTPPTITSLLPAVAPIAAACGNNGEIYVLDGQSHTISLFDSTGLLIDSLGTSADGLDLGQAMDLSIDTKGNLLIPDLPGSRVISLHPSTRTISAFPCRLPMYAIPGPDPIIYVHAMGDSCAVTVWDSQGHEKFSFGPRYSSSAVLGLAQQDMDVALNEFLLARDSQNNVFLCQPTLYELHKFTSDGTPLLRFGLRDPIRDTLLSHMRAVRGTLLVAPEGACLPYGGYAELAIQKMIVDDSDNVWLSHRSNRLDVFRADGTYRGSVDLRNATPAGDGRLIMFAFARRIRTFIFLAVPSKRIVSVKIQPVWLKDI